MHIIKDDQVIFKMDSDNAPVARVQPGDSVRFETKDCFSNDICKEADLIMDINFGTVNPATGPVFVEGAEPGDVLKVKIHKIDIGTQAAVTVATDFGLVGDTIKEPTTRIVEIRDDRAYFMDKPLPIKKMIGVIGTAPKEGAMETGNPGEHGGNYDCLMITEGATLYLPVFHEGALLALGDLHATMGEGEIGVSAAEIAGAVEVEVDVLKGAKLPVPMVENDEKIATLWSGESMEEAAHGATARMADYLTEKTALEHNDAVMLMTLAGDLIPCQVVCERVSFRMELDKKTIEQYV